MHLRSARVYVDPGMSDFHAVTAKLDPGVQQYCASGLADFPPMRVPRFD
jgi:hypothetical protein